MFIGGNYHHPTFLYESLFNLIGFFVLINFRKRNKTKLGETILLYLIWYSVGRFFIEGFRTDSLMLFDIKVAQLVSLLIIVFSVIIWYFKRKKKIYDEFYNVGGK